MIFSFIHSLRVRYAETDKMQYVYHGNYSTYYEVSRVEAFRHLGFPYKKIEDEGVVMPIISQSIDFLLQIGRAHV